MHFLYPKVCYAHQEMPALSHTPSRSQGQLEVPKWTLVLLSPFPDRLMYQKVTLFLLFCQTQLLWANWFAQLSRRSNKTCPHLVKTFKNAFLLQPLFPSCFLLCTASNETKPNLSVKQLELQTVKMLHSNTKRPIFQHCN